MSFLTALLELIVCVVVVLGIVILGHAYDDYLKKKGNYSLWVQEHELEEWWKKEMKRQKKLEKEKKKHASDRNNN